MIIIRSLSRDPAWNLYLESELLEWPDAYGSEVADFLGESLLLFYINSPCVVVGRNQSVEAEVDVVWCEARNIPILRRLSGGGTVWHDEGNINYSFITSAGKMTPACKTVLLTADKPCGPTLPFRNDSGPMLPLDDNPHASIIIVALKDMGVEATVGSRGELLVDGLKISGTARCISKGKRLFHGTLLHSVDLEAMRTALCGNPAARGRRVASIPGKVMNLNTLPGLDISAEKFLDLFTDSVRRQIFGTI